MNSVKIAELLPGDVLLERGSAFVSDLIVRFDGSIYSHAAIFDGLNIFEALARGCVAHPVDESLAEDAPQFVDVWRFASADGHKIGDPGYSFAPIKAVVDQYAAARERYAFEEIVFLALLSMSRRVVADRTDWAWRMILDRAADALNRLIDAGREPMICSELVFRCFFEAGPQYDLELANEPIGNLSPTNLVAAYRADGAEEPVADFVTPRDLSESPNLRLVGRLELPA